MFILDQITCGGGNKGIITMDSVIPTTTSLLVNIIKIGIPVILIVLGMIDLGKAVMAQKEDEIKKSQMMFVKRLISAALVFFVVAIVQLVFGLFAGKTEKNKEDIWDCISCFVSGPDENQGNYCRPTNDQKSK